MARNAGVEVQKFEDRFPIVGGVSGYASPDTRQNLYLFQMIQVSVPRLCLMLSGFKMD